MRLTKIILSLLSICCAGVYGGQWLITTVPESQYAAERTSIAIDDLNLPHISFYIVDFAPGHALKYAHFDGEKWVISTITNSPTLAGRFNDIAVDSKNVPHIVFSGGHDTLKYAKWNGEGWDISVIDYETDGGGSLAIAIDKNDLPHIVYQYVWIGGSWVRYARYNGSEWIKTDVPGTDGGLLDCDLALDNSDNPHIVFGVGVGGHLKYTYYDGNTWVPPVIIETRCKYGWACKIAVDSRNLPHIRYVDDNEPYNPKLKYCRFNGTTWDIEYIGDGGNGSIALDSKDRPHISSDYRITTYTVGLKYAYFDGSQWNTTTIDNKPNSGNFNSIAVDSLDIPHISYIYHNSLNQQDWFLKYAVYDPGTGLTLDYFRARAAEKGVAVSWATAAHEDLAGFNLYRNTPANENRVKLNDSLIAGRPPFAYVDRGVASGETYRYWLEAVALNGERGTYGPAEVRLPAKAAAFALHGNSPNPARGETTFAFSLPAAGTASLAVYDLAGREVWRHEGTFEAGANEVEATFELAPGVYVYRLTAGGEAAARKMVVRR